MNPDLAISLSLISAPIGFTLGALSVTCWFTLKEAARQFERAEQKSKMLSIAIDNAEKERGRREIVECEMAKLQGKSERPNSVTFYYPHQTSIEWGYDDEETTQIPATETKKQHDQGTEGRASKDAWGDVQG